MILVAGGDSFIWGTELTDCRHNGPNGYSRNTFTALLASSKSWDYACVAYPGNSNESIARTVINYCDQHKGQNIFVVCSWTFPCRYEFRINDTWTSVNSWDAGKMYDDNSENTPVHERLQKAKQSNIHNFASIYFDVVNSEYWEVYTALREITRLINYLKINKVPYLFTCADNSIVHSYTIQNSDETIQALLNQIEWENWYMFPAGRGANQTVTPRGFYQWARENKYPVGVTHPLEQAHQDAALLIQEKFNEVVKKLVE
jgi:hypothetical protein